MARPTEFSQEIVDIICEKIATSSCSLKTICEDESLPSAVTFYKWMKQRPELVNQYARAKEDQADFIAEEMLDIADDGSNDLMKVVKGDVEYEMENREVTNRSRLRIETRKWLLSKLKPKKYGDKLEVDGNMKHTGTVQLILNRPENTDKREQPDSDNT